MKLVTRFLSRARAFAIVIGFADGILTALTLAAGHLFNGQSPSLGLSLRIAGGSAVCGVFVFFTAEYARLRGELIRAEMQLNLTVRGRLATTKLGKRVRAEALLSAILSSGANFIGAFSPLLVGGYTHGPRVLMLSPSIIALALLGLLLAHTVQGRYILWIGGLVAAGIALSLFGVWLHIA
jgi:predicted membrane protein (TIGR00267 family)